MWLVSRNDFLVIWVRLSSIDQNNLQKYYQEFLFYYPKICNIIINHNIPHQCLQYNYTGEVNIVINEENVPFARLCGLELIENKSIYNFELFAENFLHNVYDQW